MELRVKRRAIGWENDPFSTELGLQRALAGHPCRVPTPAAAHFIFIAANLSQMCVLKKGYSAREMWKCELSKR